MFGQEHGVLFLLYPPGLRAAAGTKEDRMAFGISTFQPDAMVVRMDSTESRDFIQLRLVRIERACMYGAQSHY